MNPKDEGEIAAIRRIRHEISEECGHDVRRVAAYYLAVQDELKASGQFRFAEPRSAQCPVGMGENPIQQMVHYNLEDIAFDHPALLTDSFQACAVARCRQICGSPYRFTIDCNNLVNLGTKAEVCELAWKPAANVEAIKVTKTFQALRLTEDAAIGFSAVAFAALGEWEITEVTLRGTGADYWIDNKRAVLEVSGIKGGNQVELNQRHRDKTIQLKRGSPFKKQGYPGYVFVVSFGSQKATFTYYVNNPQTSGNANV